MYLVKFIETENRIEVDGAGKEGDRRVVLWVQSFSSQNEKKFWRLAIMKQIHLTLLNCTLEEG